ncbi:ABC transporter ATP-binding protein [Actinomadura viridis]|uniref:NitT/TauT family transport system ATP-binding protein n=1 Tax=Actinomadura viridis TaxID=58110 RepID=A0A931GK72_9ACTN|nr:ABC transporter ATP-binding protein [Actinomadura viridis]MBG6090528.1 NitT/TauT family transport system ATP-binding protein [Actinomadura viridis]
MGHDTITLSRVGKTFRRSRRPVRALSDIDLVIEDGTFVTLFGPSGCGKSTLLRIMAGLQDHDEGEVSLFGQTPRAAVRQKNIAWIPQSSALLPWLSVRSNAALSTVVNRAADRRPAGGRTSRDVGTVLAELGLDDFGGARPDQLSGGMRQRAALARGFVHGAPLMLMDEPFSALDEFTRESLRHRLLDVWERHRKTVVLVTHSAAEAVLMSDVIVVMTPRPGRVRAVVEVDLPRPRPRGIEDTPEFLGAVRRVKAELRAGWDGD